MCEKEMVSMKDKLEEIVKRHIKDLEEVKEDVIADVLASVEPKTFFQKIKSKFKKTKKRI
jgi:hypothetical protein